MGIAYHPDKGKYITWSRFVSPSRRPNTDSLLLMGDFNLRDIKWSNFAGFTDASQYFITTLEENLLHQLVRKPTRGNNILDLVIIGNLDIVDKVSIECPFSTSNHSWTDVIMRIPVPRTVKAPRKVYLYSKGDYEGFDKEVANIDWENEMKNKSVEHMWQIRVL